MENSDSFSIKKNHAYVAFGFVFLLLVIVLTGNNGKSDSGLENVNPSPTETVVVTVPGNNSLLDESQNQLDEIRENNCRISQDLMFQSIDLNRQADDLDWNSDGFDNFDQIQELRRQSIDLLIKSQELSNDC